MMMDLVIYRYELCGYCIIVLRSFLKNISIYLQVIKNHSKQVVTLIFVWYSKNITGSDLWLQHF